MTRRWILTLCLMAGFLGLNQQAWSESMRYEEGVHYAKLETPIRTKDPTKVEVTEYFSYGCPHCYQFEPLIAAWKKRLPEGVAFNRTPAIWNQDYMVYAQAYYTAEALNVLERVHTPIFNAIHRDRKRLNRQERMASFFAEFGVDPVDFAKVYKSFGVRASLAQAEARGRGYLAEGVPALIVNGKYRIEGKMAGNNANMLRVADFLINKELQMLSGAAAQ